MVLLGFQAPTGAELPPPKNIFFNAPLPPLDKFMNLIIALILECLLNGYIGVTFLLLKILILKTNFEKIKNELDHENSPKP